jgi:hypothetical protein
MYNRGLIAIVLLMSLSSHVASAEPVTLDAPLSLAQAVTRVLVAGFDVRTAATDVAIAEAEVRIRKRDGGSPTRRPRFRGLDCCGECGSRCEPTRRHNCTERCGIYRHPCVSTRTACSGNRGCTRCSIARAKRGTSSYASTHRTRCSSALPRCPRSSDACRSSTNARRCRHRSG